MGLKKREVEEVLRGMWGQESPELQGLSKADWNSLKGQQSRKNDRTRRVYDRNEVDAKRTATQWATTNDEFYLRALSGMNRRFFSIDVLSPIDISKLIADRDQLWAEALVLEATGESVMLAEEHWEAANAERLKRTEHEPWEDILCNVGPNEPVGPIGHRRLPSPTEYEMRDDGEERVSSGFLFDMLDFAPKERQPYHGTKIGKIMRKLRWSGPKDTRIGKVNCKGYSRMSAQAAAAQAAELESARAEFAAADEADAIEAMM